MFAGGWCLGGAPPPGGVSVINGGAMIPPKSGGLKDPGKGPRAKKENFSKRYNTAGFTQNAFMAEFLIPT